MKDLDVLDGNLPVYTLIFNRLSPTKCQNGFVKGEALRILRKNSSKAMFEEVF